MPRKSDRPHPPSIDALGIVSADLTERVADAMRAASRTYIVALLEGLAEEGHLGLTAASVALLALIPQDGAQAVAIARASRRSKQATGKLLAELEVLGFVERIEDPTDMRARLVRLTKRGRAAIAAGVAIKARLSKRATAILGEEAMARLHTDLSKLEKALSGG